MQEHFTTSIGLKWMRHKGSGNHSRTKLAIILSLMCANSAPAQTVTLSPPFTGTNSETWERFGLTKIPNGTAILGGIATISGTNLKTYGPRQFPLCIVNAEPSDGSVLLGSDRPSGPLVISFSKPVSAFGAYWGSGVNCYGDPPSILTFRDAAGNLVGTSSFNYEGDGTLTWHGYRFGTPVKTIIRTAGDRTEGVVIDGLQATLALTSPLLYNVSTRGFVETGNDILIGGLIISGSGPKKVLLRALGPTLGQPPSSVPGAMANPTLTLLRGSTVIASNDNWPASVSHAAISATSKAPPNSLEAAILTSLNPGSYTALVRGVNNSTGVALFEAYDLDPTASSKFGNLSTRGFVQTGNNVMIAGVIVVGPNSKNVLIRALGPTLGEPPFNVPDSLADPFLDLRNSNGARIGANDNWKSTQQAQIQATGLAPPNDAEAAIATILPPGNYTAIVSGVNNTTGNALVEIYGWN